jgi:hypothetical protein
LDQLNSVEGISRERGEGPKETGEQEEPSRLGNEMAIERQLKHEPKQKTANGIDRQGRDPGMLWKQARDPLSDEVPTEGSSGSEKAQEGEAKKRRHLWLVHITFSTNSLPERLLLALMGSARTTDD